ncbi:S41 family peptidase [Arsukibacterium sp.]|uniref:S41 family peptidase n=1 Tax=Arsukibacterium sp. TaxID=1977258 RepID=UPI003567393C
MKGLVCSLVLCGCSVTATASPQNIDFTEITDGKPKHWSVEGSEPLSTSKVGALDNATAVKISRNEFTSGDYAEISQQLEFTYGGNIVTISGYIKTSNVDGVVGFWLSQTSTAEQPLEYQTMEILAVSGSRDWQRYTLSVEIESDTKILHVGMRQQGTGSSEYAKLSLTIDGKPLAQAPERQQPVYPAALPHAFEKNSGIRLTALSQQEQENLAALAKVWGFIKYYHPESAAGNISMDAELFKLIPDVLKADAKKRDQLLITWINSLGQLSACIQCKDITDAALAHREQHWLVWQLSPELNATLAKVYATELPARHFWVKSEPNVNNPAFNEKPYAEIGFDDSGYRLLSLFRLWNIIHYYSPYRDLTEQPWQQVLYGAISKVLLAKTELDYQLELAQVIDSIHDTHSQFGPADFNVIRPYIGKNIAPVDVRFAEQHAVVYQIYQPELPIKIGDVITHINDKPISERLAHLRPLAAASNEPTRLRIMASMLLRGNAEQISVQVRRNTESLQLQLPLLPADSIERQHYYHEHGDTAFQHLAPDIGYIRMDKINEVDLKQMMAALADTKGLIIDIRNYPSKYVVYSLSNYLYPEPYDFVQFTQMHLTNPGQFNRAESLSVGHNNPAYYKGKVVILINEQTQSLAEYTTMAFQGAPKATVIGSTTSGADGDVSYFMLPGGHYTALSGVGVFYPDGTPTQRIGIVPDIEVKPTIAGIAAGRDEQLERAIEFIKQ